MRFLIIIKASAESEAGQPPDAGLIDAMADFHTTLARSGVLLDAAGLAPSADGWRIHYSDKEPVLERGPFTAPGELIAGYTLIQARNHDEALEWARRFPNPRGAGRPTHIELRPVCCLADTPA